MEPASVNPTVWRSNGRVRETARRPQRRDACASRCVSTTPAGTGKGCGCNLDARARRRERRSTPRCQKGRSGLLIGAMFNWHGCSTLKGFRPGRKENLHREKTIPGHSKEEKQWFSEK